MEQKENSGDQEIERHNKCAFAKVSLDPVFDFVRTYINLCKVSITPEHQHIPVTGAESLSFIVCRLVECD
jgi:hypothetical protein